jgi:AAA domain
VSGEGRRRLHDAVRAERARRLRAERFLEVKAEATRWLWDGRIPLGTATLLVGREKLGKSTLSTELAARLSRGELPGDLQAAAALVVSYEDSASRTIKPRLMAANADLSRVHRVVAGTRRAH